jgi:hypothetical protein
MTIMKKAIMKKPIRRHGSMIAATGTLPRVKVSPSVIPNMSKIEYTVSIYEAIAPITMSIHTTSRVLDHNMMAKKDARVPKASLLTIKTISPASI